MKETVKQAIADLRELLDEGQVSENVTILEQHSKDQPYHTPKLPDVVVYPKNTAEVSEIVKIADSYQISIIPFVLGSSLEGHVIPTGPTITINFSLMNQILEVKEKDFLIKVQPGITRSKLDKELNNYRMS